MDKNYLHKYQKYKYKYNNLIKQKGGNIQCVKGDERYIIQQNKIQNYIDEYKKGNMNIYNDKLYKENNNDDYIQVISFKNKCSLKHININKNYDINVPLIEKYYTYNEKCLNDFEKENHCSCFLYVSFENDLINNIKKKIDLNKDNNDIRIKIMNLLGIRCEWGNYDCVLLLKVNKNDIIRPCKKMTLLDNICYDKDTIDDEKINYNKWYNNYLNDSHKQKIPFTGLGYTYDLNDYDNNNNINNNEKIFGQAEFIVKPQSKIQIIYVYDTNSYINYIRNKIESLPKL